MTECLKVMGDWYTQTEGNMKGNLKVIKRTEKASSSGKMERSTKDLMLMTKSTDLEHTTGSQKGTTKGTG